ncbi:MAG: DsrE family protein [Chloroflexota bacterium]
MKLAIMLAASDDANARTALGLAEAALHAGHEAFLFLDGDGVLGAASFAALGAAGATLVGCGLSAHQRGAVKPEHVRWGNQMDWALAVREADKVVVLA